jgi:DNA-binding CsgD family transcriptional regulator
MALVVAVRGRDASQEDSLKKRFDLTPAEARLVVHLVAGTSLKSSAKALGIKYESARTCLKSIFRKTRTHRQPQLVLTVCHAISHDNHPELPIQVTAQELARDLHAKQ